MISTLASPSTPPNKTQNNKYTITSINNQDSLSVLMDELRRAARKSLQQSGSRALPAIILPEETSTIPDSLVVLWQEISSRKPENELEVKFNCMLLLDCLLSDHAIRYVKIFLSSKAFWSPGAQRA